MRKLSILLLSLAICSTLFGQNKSKTENPYEIKPLNKVTKNKIKVTQPNYELASQFSSSALSKLVYSTHIVPKWFKNSDKFWYIWKTSKGFNIYVVNPAKKTKEAVFDVPKLAMQITEITKDPYDAQHLPLQDIKLVDDKYFTFYVIGSQDRVMPNKDKKDTPEKQKFYFKYDIANHKLIDVTKEEQDKGKKYPDFASISPDGTMGVYVKNCNLYLMDSANLRKAAKDPNDSTIVERQLTKNGTKEFSWGFDHEIGNTVTDSTKRVYIDNLVWSPDSKKFATLKWDLRPVKDLWVINSISQPRPTLERYKYQMPGEPGPKGYLYVFDLPAFTSQKVKTYGFKDQTMFFEVAKNLAKDYNGYKTNVWKGDNNGFYLVRFSRDQKRMDLCYHKIGTDSLKVIVPERMNTYVENRPIWLINNGKQFIQWSERNGWANLYLYNADGSLVKNLTEGDFHVENVLGVNEKDGYMVIAACGVNKNENPYQMHTYKVSLKGGKLQQIDMPDMDVHSFVSDDGRYAVANYSRVDCKPEICLIDTKSGKIIMNLESADFSRLLAAGYKFPERFKVKAADGITDLYGAMYKPYDFDSTKLYAICDYVYPGPQVEANNISWSSRMTRTDRLAQLGFIVITVGNRGGHPNRSKWYHNYGYGNLRDYGLADQKYAIQQLAERYPFIDINRVGIHGHSGGGFMSTAAILKYPDFFKVAVSCAGNHDNSIYNRWWSEQHHGVKEVVKDGDTTFLYHIDTNQEIAKNLKGHLMLVTGDMDDNVNPANTIRVVNALIRANKRFDLLILPGQRHGFGDMNEYFFWRMADYYSEWLMGHSKRGQVDIIELNND